MQKDDEFKIQLRVAGKVFPLNCKRSEEELYRKAAVIINDLINRYKACFEEGIVSSGDLLAMAAVHISVENLLLRQIEDTSPLLEKVNFLNKELEEYFQANNIN